MLGATYLELLILGRYQDTYLVPRCFDVHNEPSAAQVLSFIRTELRQGLRQGGITAVRQEYAIGTPRNTYVHFQGSKVPRLLTRLPRCVSWQPGQCRSTLDKLIEGLSRADVSVQPPSVQA